MRREFGYNEVITHKHQITEFSENYTAKFQTRVLMKKSIDISVSVSITASTFIYYMLSLV